MSRFVLSQDALDDFVANLFALVDSAPSDREATDRLTRLVIALAAHAPDARALSNAVQASLSASGRGAED